jgi:hypothetical protein
MKKFWIFIFFVVIQPVALMLSAQADDHDGGPGMQLNHVSTQSDTAILIKKNPKDTFDKPDYEIISGDEEVFGDPTAGTQASYASWKVACDTWKKEVRDMNKDNQVLALSCGMPSFTQDGGVYTYKSKGAYKIRVRIRDKR